MSTKSVIALFARDHGLSGLQSLIDAHGYELRAIFTHRRLPRSEDESRRDRPEWATYRRLAKELAIPIVSVDTRAEVLEMERMLASERFDLLAAISWRRMIPAHVLDMPRFGGINLHRGELPAFKGGRPIHQALSAGRREISVSAHVLVEQLDAGDVLATYRHPARREEHESVEKAEQRLKTELTPHFGPLLLRALDEIVARAAQ